MGFFALLLTGIGLSMDAFAVSICKGLCMPEIRWRQALVIALFFGVFQGVMPVIGWFLGSAFAAYIEPVDHWIAFILLACVGGKMLIDAFREGDEDVQCGPDKLDIRELTALAVGYKFGARFNKGATIAGGVLLILIGLKILLEHMGVLAM